jgi:hypothetical protein
MADLTQAEIEQQDNEYEVRIAQITYTRYVVEANSEDEALEKGRAMYDGGEDGEWQCDDVRVEAEDTVFCLDMEKVL